MASLYQCYIHNKQHNGVRSVAIVAENFHDAYGLARGICKQGEEVSSIDHHGDDLIICPQVAKDAAKHS